MLSQGPSIAAIHSRCLALARSELLVVLVDLDGTLIEFAPSPEQASLDDEAIQLLGRVLAAGVQVVIVSGRTSASIDAMRHLVPGAWWVAEHGSWRWDPQLTTRPAAGAPGLDELDELAARLASLVVVPGTLVERKSRSLCIHWRRVAPARRDGLVSAVEVACDEWLEEHPSFERLDGVELLEIRHRDVHKGVVVHWVRDRIRSARIVAIGDDATDEDMFAELDDSDLSVGVGPRAAHMPADASAADVAAARSFLGWIAETRAGRELPLPIVPAASAAQRKRHRLLVMSNRTPALTEGRMREVGGLVSALEPALRDEHGIWLGWSGQEHTGERVVIDASSQPARARFDLPGGLREQFYAGFCNRVLWPLFHGFPVRVCEGEGDWNAYEQVNERYARHAVGLAQRDATIWVHDYHLLRTARALRALGHCGRIGLFLHIPFPPRGALAGFAWGVELVDSMLEFDLIGFQTRRFADNFLAAAQGASGASVLPGGVRRGDRITVVDVFPATIDPQPFRARTEEVHEVAGLRTALGERRLILGVDRLDYSKGIPERLEAYERMIEHYPEWRRRVSFLQISVPSRAGIPEYAELRDRVEHMVGRINGRFGETDWVPVRYLYRSYDQRVLAQLYRLADVALVTPLCDGMNLVAKEFVAAQDPARPGVLVLSRHAGAAETLASALITDPFHPANLAADIDYALRMPHGERVHRHRMLVEAVEREGDARVWAQRFLDRLAPDRLAPDRLAPDRLAPDRPHPVE